MKKLSLLLVLFFCFSLNPSFAQFEGQIEFKSYDIKSGERVPGDDSAVLHITPDRMFLQSDENYQVGNALKAEGILVRHKEQDFVFLTGEKEAMSISKAGITTFMNFFGADAKKGAKEAESNIKIEQTGESKTINDYTAEKFVFSDKENPNERSEVWMTKDLNVNWGVLAQSWNENLKGFFGGDFPFNLIFNDGYFPIVMEQYENDELNSVVEAEVTTTDVARSMVQLSPDVKVTSLQDYLFNQMRKNTDQN